MNAPVSPLEKSIILLQCQLMCFMNRGYRKFRCSLDQKNTARAGHIEFRVGKLN
jgi:hypothetical protein